MIQQTPSGMGRPVAGQPDGTVSGNFTPSGAVHAAAAKHGVSGGEVNQLYKNGLTEATVTAAESHGINLKDILDLYNQFGPTFLLILNSLVGLLKSPSPQPVPEPAPQPTPEPVPESA